MKKFILVLCLQLVCFILYSQKQEVKNIADLTEIIFSDSIKNSLSKEDVKNYERDYSFLSSRFDHSGTIAGYQKAVQNYFNSVKFSDKKSLSATENLTVLNWDYLGPIGFNDGPLNQTRNSLGRGWIETIKAIDQDTIYAGARNSGLWYTANGGNSWINISESEPLINGILSILIDPDDKQHIFVLTGVQTSSELGAYSNGIFETLNHGISWSRVSTTISGEEIFSGSHNELRAIKLVSHPLNFEDLYLVTASSLYRRQYETGGWLSVYHSNYWNVANSDLVFDENNPNIFYLGGIVTYKCNINGSIISMQNITELITNSLTDTIMKCLIGINENFLDNIWFYYRDTSGYNHITKYCNGTYDSKPGSLLGGQRTMNIFPSATDANIVYLGWLQMYKYDGNTNSTIPISTSSLDTNLTPDSVSDFLHDDIRDLQVIKVNGDDKLYVGHDGGVAWGEYSRGSCGSPRFCWHQISDDGTNGLQTNEFYGIYISKSNPIRIGGGTQDCSSFIWLEDSSEWWHAKSSDGVEGAFSRVDPDKVIIGGGVGTQNYALFDLLNTSTPINIKTFDGTLKNRVISHPTANDIIFIGADSLYEISDCYSSPQVNSISIPSEVDRRISALAICYNNPEIKYIGESLYNTSLSSSDHMWRYSPSSSSWVDIGQNLPEYTNSYANDIVVNPENDMEVWVCMGQAVNEDRKVFHSENGGSSWTALSLGYPENIPANRLLYDFVTGKLYVATDVGIFFWNTYKPENGWSAITATLPFKLVTDIEIDYLKPRLIAGTYGRGIWQAELPESNCYDETPLIVTSSQTWSADEVICQSIKVQNYSTLTITGNITLSEAATITVEGYCSLVINSGTLVNGNIIVKPYGSLTIMNNGIVQLNENDNVNCELGSVFHFNEGGVETLTD
ncbi:MAG: hypothetical protein K9H49_17410 [Bacteroidales bacterium]|nr:hypothetical protein [Bacteroidales bacterium]MCF8390196.1 hypothetical protein [Bacteroidales bacterium]